MRLASRFLALIVLLAAVPLHAKADTQAHRYAVQQIGANMAFATIDDGQSFNKNFSLNGDMVDGSPPAHPNNDPGMVFDSDSSSPETVPVVESTPTLVPDDPSLKPSPAASALSPADSTQSASPGPAQADLTGRQPELPQPSLHDVRQELWAEWADKFQLLQDENTALRDKLRMAQGDGLTDIRVDSVAEIEKQALKSRIADLEKEVEKLRAKKVGATASGAAALPGSGPMNLNNEPSSPLARTHAD